MTSSPTLSDLNTHTRAYLARAPLGVLLNCIADVVSTSGGMHLASNAATAARAEVLREDATVLRRGAADLHTVTETFGTSSNLADGLELDDEASPTRSDEAQALSYLAENGQLEDELLLDTVKRLLATAVDHIEAAALMHAAGAAAAPSILPALRGFIGRNPVGEDFRIREALLTVRGSASVLDTARRLVAAEAARLKNPLVAIDLQHLIDALVAAKDGNEEVVETALRVIRVAAEYEASATKARAPDANGDDDHARLVNVLGKVPGNESALALAERLVERELLERAQAAGPMCRPDPWRFLADSGLLGEINRRVLHPLGMALVVGSHADPSRPYFFVGLRWEQDDLEGIYFGDPRELAGLRGKFAGYMAVEGDVRHATRLAALGYIVEGEETASPSASVQDEPIGSFLEILMNHAPPRARLSIRTVRGNVVIKVTTPTPRAPGATAAAG